MRRTEDDESTRDWAVCALETSAPCAPDRWQDPAPAHSLRVSRTLVSNPSRQDMGSLSTPKFTKRHRIVATYGGAAIIVTIGVLTFLARRQANKSRQGVDHTYAVMQATSRTRSDIQDAETGQRGFLLTGDESYLTP